MNGWLIAIVCIIFLVFILWFSVIHIDIEYKREHENDQLLVELFAWWKLIRYKKIFPLFKLKGEGLVYEEEEKTKTPGSKTTKGKRKRIFSPQDIYHIRITLDQWLHRIHNLNKIMRRTLKKVRCDQLEWKTKIGLGDAPATGTFSGLIWGIKGCLIGIIAHYVTLRSMPKVHVVPDFNRKCLELNLKGRFRFRLGNAIIAGIRIYFNFIRKKG